ncbi:hypothetical protein ABH926_006729 [Catenulispora sp. GP43]|uniref:hypothetical protein n=1 Tax=Catenulispora sp. GP43 TaxID=3156263 RepID=UPI00351847AA
MNPDQLSGTLMAVAAHSSLGSDRLSAAADKIRTPVIDAASLRRGQLETLTSLTDEERRNYYFLFQVFAREFMVPRLRTGTAEERAALFDTVEQGLADGDVLIDDAVDNEIIDELVYVGHTLRDDPVDLTGAGPLTTERIDRTRNWRPGT